MRIAILSDIHGNSIALDAVIRQLARAHHPAAEYIARFMRGEQKPSWSKNLSAADAQRLGLPTEILQ